MRTVGVFLSLALAVVCGCTSVPVNAPARPVNLPVFNGDGPRRVAVVYALDRVDSAAYGGWNGSCPGTLVDASRMRALLLSRGYTVVTLTNAQATAFRVTAACVAVARDMKPGDKLVVFGAGHGGQVDDVDGDEAGGKDSTICLYDGQFTDDLVYRMLVRVPAGVDVDFVTDCCNAGTNYRGPHDYGRIMRARTRDTGAVSCNFTHMGGAGDGESSYGGPSGGVFTAALIDAWHALVPAPDAFAAGPTRRRWFTEAATRMPRNQEPVLSSMGGNVLDQEALK